MKAHLGFSKKTTILFNPVVYEKLARIAKERGESVAHLVRESAVQKYLLPDQSTRIAALKALSSMNLPVSDWPEMEREILKGRQGKNKR